MSETCVPQTTKKRQLNVIESKSLCPLALARFGGSCLIFFESPKSGDPVIDEIGLNQAKLIPRSSALWARGMASLGSSFTDIMCGTYGWYNEFSNLLATFWVTIEAHLEWLPTVYYVTFG